MFTRDITEELYPDQAASRSQDLKTTKMKIDTFYKFIENDEKWEQEFRQETSTRPTRANTVPGQTSSSRVEHHSAEGRGAHTTEDMLDSMK